MGKQWASGKLSRVLRSRLGGISIFVRSGPLVLIMILTVWSCLEIIIKP